MRNPPQQCVAGQQTDRQTNLQNSTKTFLVGSRATDAKFFPTRTLTASLSQSSGMSSDLKAAAVRSPANFFPVSMLMRRTSTTELASTPYFWNTSGLVVRANSVSERVKTSVLNAFAASLSRF
ncbi:hypothetical protein EYF80_037110 [Liparis tanakae]|uniref:Uncharacterized protein n=1 Tax=Liparis tanakae TaxID=230148 RepID=A0A4Z2GGW3_9TELE|nr:hypothetical protein EYF80_037110 [Liparis tanakae]